MCVIIAAISNKPTLSVIEQCYKANPHGIGIAARANGKVSYYKGMEPQAAFEVSQTIELPFIMHFRLASAGSSDDFTLNHPFPITKSAYPTKHGTADKVLFHNGHITGWEEKLFSFLTTSGKHFSGAWSDTRLCALMAHKFGVDSMAAVFSNQKFVTFSAKSMVFYGDWEDEKDGMVFSNYYWKIQSTVVKGYQDYSRYYRQDNLPLRSLPARHRKKDDFLDANFNDTDFPVG